ncbi:MAG: hypothetical protein AXA67_06095 [Methylothermaceae bacteria B42]|nr:MAG: hypothetical protein AXA67_06095 [Methylothermaceae bacteria B42]HHJ40362.1 BON domain-containing protein [Methylothermaceae bacterium]
MNQNELAKAVRAALELDPWVNPHRDQIEVECLGNVAILKGEVAEISAKRRAYYCALEIKGVSAVDDRLYVRPAEAMGDEEILDHLAKALYGDLVFQHYGLVRVDHKGDKDVWRQLETQEGEFILHVADGRVHLEGKVKSLCDRRLAEVYGWWVPGSRNVKNDLSVIPPEEDSDDQLLEALRVVLDADRFVEAVEVACLCQNFEVTLKGVVPFREQIKLAENDCWYTEGVKKVDNQLDLP